MKEIKFKNGVVLSPLLETGLPHQAGDWEVCRENERVGYFKNYVQAYRFAEHLSEEVSHLTPAQKKMIEEVKKVIENQKIFDLDFKELDESLLHHSEAIRKEAIEGCVKEVVRALGANTMGVTKDKSTVDILRDLAKYLQTLTN